MLRIRQGLREGHRLLPEFRPREDAVEEAPFEGVLRRDHAPGRHEVDCAALADEAGEPLGPAGSRQDAEGDLWQADPPCAVGCDPEIRRHRDLEAAADAVSVDRRDEQLRRALHLVQDLLAVEAEHRLVVRRRRREEVDVRTGGPDPIELRCEDADVDVVVESDRIDGPAEILHEVRIVRVGLRLVHPCHRDAVFLLERDVRQVHRLRLGALQGIRP